MVIPEKQRAEFGDRPSWAGCFVPTFCVVHVVSLSVILEMLSKPRIFYDSSSEVIKGQTIAVSCQSINGTTPISYHLLKTSNILESRDMSSNEPAVFKDNPTKDTEYQCIVDNCHSHSEMVSEVLRVKVIGKLLCLGRNLIVWGLYFTFSKVWGCPGIVCTSGWY